MTLLSFFFWFFGGVTSFVGGCVCLSNIKDTQSKSSQRLQLVGGLTLMFLGAIMIARWVIY